MDLFAGPGGCDEGLRLMGRSDVVGIESDIHACATRADAGHKTIRADVRHMPTGPMAGRVEGLIASPPCTPFSQAGNGDGRALIAELCDDVTNGRWAATSRVVGLAGLVLEVGRWIESVGPDWLVCEQVPQVLPVWEAYRDRLRRDGWSAWAGVLCAADYGVPQTRERAFLIAHRDRLVHPPAPTHAKDPQPGLFGTPLERWLSMADALGWTGHGEMQPGGGAKQYVRRVPTSSPSPTLAFGNDYSRWVWHQPATTVCGDPVRLTLPEALTLQGFPSDYPLRGSERAQWRQVGNAVPPPLAAAVLAQVAAPALEAAA